MNKSSKIYSTDDYKPGGIYKKISFYRWMISSRIDEIKKLEQSGSEREIEQLRENLKSWQRGLSRFTSEPNNDPDVVKTIFQSLSNFATKQDPTNLYLYMDELRNITIDNSDVNYLLEIIGDQRETFERVYFDDAVDNIDETQSRAEAETEIGLPPDTRKIATLKTYVKLAKHYDKTQQYKKADIVTKIFLQ
jgi:hypothetical protein